jgi:hypothetical protein
MTKYYNLMQCRYFMMPLSCLHNLWPKKFKFTIEHDGGRSPKLRYVYSKSMF